MRVGRPALTASPRAHVGDSLAGLTALRGVVDQYERAAEPIGELVGSVRFVDFRGLGFNPLHVIDRAARMAYLDVAGALRDIFVAIFPELGELQGELIRKAIKDSFVERGWDNSDTPMAELAEPDFSRFVEILRDIPKPDRGLKNLLARLEELRDYGFFNVAETQESLWQSSAPVIVRIHSTQNDNLQKAFASLVFYGLYKDMFRRGIQERITHAVVFDEAHRAAKLALKHSIRSRKGSALPGKPPHSHKGTLRRLIFFGYDKSSDSVVVGPVGFRRSIAPNVLEFGGKATLVRRRRGKLVRERTAYDSRPFMGPALEKERPKLPSRWANSLRGG